MRPSYAGAGGMVHRDLDVTFLCCFLLLYFFYGALATIVISSLPSHIGFFFNLHSLKSKSEKQSTRCAFYISLPIFPSNNIYQKMKGQRDCLN